MVNSVPPNSSSIVPANNQNFEIFSLIWLDQDVESQYIQNAENKLRSNINLIKKFLYVKKCQQYVEDLSPADRVVMIVSGGLGQQIVPSIHKLRQVISIYVYCMNKERNKRWSKYFTKVKGVINEVDELVSQINTDRQIQRNLDEPFSHNLFNVNCGNGTSTSDINGKFIFSQVLIDCILRIKSNEEDKNELITCCKQYYAGSCMTMNHLDEFEKTYSPDKVLWWYSRESFFYNVLNRALRNENIHIIFLFREFISDIYHQLKEYQVKTPITTYRCQLMSSDELKTMKASVGHFISVNSFFSTSASAKEARSFIHTFFIRDNLEPVLFEFNGEFEVVLCLVLYFVWTAEDAHGLKEVFLHIKKQYSEEDVNLGTCAKLLWKLGKFNLAELYYMRFLKMFPPNDPLVGKIYENLCELASQTGDYDKSIDLHKKCIEHEKLNRLGCSIDGHNASHHIVFPTIPVNARWAQHGVTVAGELQNDDMTYQLCLPYSFCIDDDSQTMIIADYGNDRIVQLKMNSRNGEILAGGGGVGTQLDQLNQPTDVIIDKKTNSLIICDRQNRRYLRWSLSKGTVQGEILFDNIRCWGLAIDDQNNVYISDTEKHAVIRYTMNDKNGTIVAGGQGRGAALNQLNNPTYIFVDQQQNVYVSERGNHRVTKWKKGASQGIVVAGGHGQGKLLTQVSQPEGLFVDTSGTCNDK
ncbi:unnamed protein product [Rotaria socialis]|uniref:Uncharacterized protein n=1 Tax=Rotaria socialis TaxID=392032 RepID=A0A820U9K1_9BILA|nr:unnamed protein product [Rotaria socialis]CAF4479118.1 unnamed protein product [Rotaria socialis]